MSRSLERQDIDLCKDTNNKAILYFLKNYVVTLHWESQIQSLPSRVEVNDRVNGQPFTHYKGTEMLFRHTYLNPSRAKTTKLKLSPLSVERRLCSQQTKLVLSNKEKKDQLKSFTLSSFGRRLNQFDLKL